MGAGGKAHISRRSVSASSCAIFLEAASSSTGEGSSVLASLGVGSACSDCSVAGSNTPREGVNSVIQLGFTDLTAHSLAALTHHEGRGSSRLKFASRRVHLRQHDTDAPSLLQQV